MMAFPGMLISACEKAGIKCPSDPDNGDWDRDEYPHFAVFCALQLGRRIRLGEHWDNAKVIAKIPEDEIKTLTLVDFISRGLEFST